MYSAKPMIRDDHCNIEKEDTGSSAAPAPAPASDPSHKPAVSDRSHPSNLGECFVFIHDEHVFARVSEAETEIGSEMSMAERWMKQGLKRWNGREGMVDEARVVVISIISIIAIIVIMITIVSSIIKYRRAYLKALPTASRRRP